MPHLHKKCSSIVDELANVAAACLREPPCSVARLAIELMLARPPHRAVWLSFRLLLGAKEECDVRPARESARDGKSTC